MPRKDGTGPMGKGARTGKGLGTSPIDSRTGSVSNLSWLSRLFGFGRRGGQGRGMSTRNTRTNKRF